MSVFISSLFFLFIIAGLKWEHDKYIQGKLVKRLPPRKVNGQFSKVKPLFVPQLGGEEAWRI